VPVTAISRNAKAARLPRFHTLLPELGAGPAPRKVNNGS